MDEDICLNSKGVRVIMSSTSWKLCKQLRYNNGWSRVLTVLHMRSTYLVFILEYIIIQGRSSKLETGQAVNAPLQTRGVWGHAPPGKF